MHKFLKSAFFICSALAALGWAHSFTVRCEGFGCYGKAMGMFFSLALGAVAAIIGAWWLRQRLKQGDAPAWLWVMEIVLAVPVIGFIVSLIING